MIGPRADIRLPGRALRQVLLLTSLTLLQGSLLAPWLVLLSGGRSAPDAIVAAALASVGLGAASIQILSERFNLRPTVRTAMDAVTLLVLLGLLAGLVLRPISALAPLVGLAQLLKIDASLATPPVELFVVISVLLVWRNGRRYAAGEGLAPTRTGLRFRAGVLVFALVIIARRLSGFAAIPSTLAVFFGASLMAMSLSRVRGLSHFHAARETPFTAGWLASLLLLFAGVILLGLGTGRAMASPFAARLLEGIWAILLILLGFLFVLARPVLNFLSPILEWMTQQLVFLLIALVQTVEGALTEGASPPELSAGEPVPPPDALVSLFNWLRMLGRHWPTIRMGLLILALGLFIFFTVRAGARRRRRGGSAEQADMGESLAPDGWLDGLRSRIGAARDELERWGRALIGGQILSAIAIRRIYGRLLKLAAEAGRPRKVAETPLEFQRALSRLYPQARSSIEMITRAYVEVRYGEYPEDPRTVARVRQAYSIVRKAATGKLD